MSGPEIEADGGVAAPHPQLELPGLGAAVRQAVAGCHGADAHLTRYSYENTVAVRTLTEVLIAKGLIGLTEFEQRKPLVAAQVAQQRAQAEAEGQRGFAHRAELHAGPAQLADQPGISGGVERGDAHGVAARGQAAGEQHEETLGAVTAQRVDEDLEDQAGAPARISSRAASTRSIWASVPMVMRR